MKNNETTPLKEKDKIPIRRTLLVRCHPPLHPANRTRNGGFVAYPKKD
jgi:phage pi2 protein 07